LVIATTLIFGSFMPLVQKALVPPAEADAHEYDEKDDEDETNEVEGRDKTEGKKINNSDSKHGDDHEEFLHPNAMRDSEYDNSPRGRISRSEFAK
jgi:hypothetical protein